MQDREKLLQALAEVNEDVNFDGETALVDDGLIDSLEITAIIAALDETFDVCIQAADIEPKNFNSVDAMLDLIKRYLKTP